MMTVLLVTSAVALFAGFWTWALARSAMNSFDCLKKPSEWPGGRTASK